MSPIIYPEDAKWHDRYESCRLAFNFGLQRGRKAARGIAQDSLRPLPFDTPERMAYYRGYAKGYRRQQHGT